MMKCVSGFRYKIENTQRFIQYYNSVHVENIFDVFVYMLLCIKPPKIGIAICGNLRFFGPQTQR